MKEILCVMGAVLLIIPIYSTGTEMGALNYYNERGIELSNSGHYHEANEKFEIVQWLKVNDWGDAPVIAGIGVSGQEAMANNSTFYIQEIGDGANLVFSLSNPNNVGDIDIKPIFVDVLNYTPNRLSNETRHLQKKVPPCEFRCNISKKENSYECEMAENSDELIRLSPGEQESLNIILRAKEEGVYRIRISFDYARLGEVKRYSDRQNIILEFFDSKKRRDGLTGA